MSRWFTLTSLLVLSTLTPAGAQPPSAPWSGYYPDAASYGGNGYPGPDGQVSQAGWQTSKVKPDKFGNVKYKYNRGANGPMGPLPSGPGRTIYEELPDDRGFLYNDAPIDRFLKDAFRHAYFRTEYLLWDISDAGDTFLGAGSNYETDLGPVNDQSYFQLPDENSGTVLNVFQPRLSGISSNENNGIRGTFGLPVFNAGTFEASIFTLQSNVGRVSASTERGFPSTDADTNGDGVPDTAVSVPLINAGVQGVLINGGLPDGNNFLLWSGIDTDGDGNIDTPTYDATMKTQVWGTEANFLIEPYDANNPLQISPILGFRYLSFRENLRQTGLYDDPILDQNGQEVIDPVTGRTVTQQVRRRIDSSVHNNLLGPQIGLRAETRQKWFALGVQPKVMMGVNTYRASLDTQNVLTINDPAQNLVDKGTTFGLVGDLEVYSRLYLGDHFSAFVGYNFMWVGSISRPADNIRYNVSTATANSPLRSDFSQDINYSGAILQGLSVGAQLEY